MSRGRRSFGALVSQDSVCLVEYAAERTGIRVLEQWTDNTRSVSIDDALARLVSLLSARGARNAVLALAIEQFGVFHHVMALPDAVNDVLRPVIRREVQRVFGMADPVIVFTRGLPQERREPARADARTAPRQLFVGGAPHETIEALRDKLAEPLIDVEIVTVVPKAIHSLYEASGGALEPTAVLVCLDGGPHLSFFLAGRLELAIDPPIALDGERPAVPMMLDQIERGAVYFRQQFRGATATRFLVAAPEGEYDTLASALEERLGVRVDPLFAGTSSPEAVVAMGAVLEAQSDTPLDLFPHAPTLSERLSVLSRGPNLAVGSASAAALIAGLWALSQFATLSSVRKNTAALQDSIQRDLSAVAPMRLVAQRRSDFAHQVEFVRTSEGERSELTTTLEAISEETPLGIRFDSLRVSRTPSGWSAAINGQATGATAAQAVHNLDAFFNSVRTREGVSPPNLDQFDYPAATPDSTRSASRGIVIIFRLTFDVARGGNSEGRR